MATAHPTPNRADGEPPSYAATFPERDPTRTDVIKTACRALDHRAPGSPSGNADARSVHRLRNWLCYMLTVDYEVAPTASAPPITLAAADAAHFDNLFAALEAYTKTTTQPRAATAATAAAEAAEIESLFWRHIHLPCLALNIPTAAVALRLRRFAVNKAAPLGTYAGHCCRCRCHAVLETHGGARGWAAALLTDRSVIVPRVAPDRAVEQGLLQAIERVEDAWFVRLDGFDCEVAERLGLRPPERVKGREDDDSGWRHVAVGAFELTEMGRRWEARWRELRGAGGGGGGLERRLLGGNDDNMAAEEAMVVAEQQQQQHQQQQNSGSRASWWRRTKWRFRTLGRMVCSSLGQQ